MKHAPDKTKLEPTSDNQTLGILLRDRSKPANILCSHCKYDLSATPIDSRCPECGMEVVASIVHYAERASAASNRGMSQTTISAVIRLALTLGLLLFGGFVVFAIGRLVMM